MLKLDALFTALGALFFLIIALLAQINPPTEMEKQHQPGNLVVSITWAQGPDDVDVWLAAPGDGAIGYSNKSGRVWSLLRDDLGVTGDTTPFNYESAYSRGIPDGNYGVNVHCFKCTGPVEVYIEIGVAGGSKIWTGRLTVPNQKERTALRWKMSDGAFVRGSETQTFKPIRGEM